MLLVSEPEAAAIFTARYLKETMGRDFLKVFLYDGKLQLVLISQQINERFVLCDAGGGTVVSSPLRQTTAI
jgi:hypothetical protein